MSFGDDQELGRCAGHNDCHQSAGLTVGHDKPLAQRIQSWLEPTLDAKLEAEFEGNGQTNREEQ